MIRSGGDGEAPDVFQWWGFSGMVILDEVGKGALFDNFPDKFNYFILLAHEIELNGAIRQVFHIPDKIKAHGKLLDRVAKTNPLNPALKNDLFGDHGDRLKDVRPACQQE